MTYNQDATTNPSLILAAAGKTDYDGLINSAVAAGKQASSALDEQVEKAMDRLVSSSYLTPFHDEWH